MKRREMIGSQRRQDGICASSESKAGGKVKMMMKIKMFSTKLNTCGQHLKP